MWKLRPERLWMPVQALPFFLPKDIQTTVTIHDLAFKYFPDHFPKKDQRRLHMFADFAVKKADKLIAVSESTKRDILKWYPGIQESKIKVIYHGFDDGLFRNAIADEHVLHQYRIKSKQYLLYVGAIQPRKNIMILLDAFTEARKNNPDMKLVLAGEKAWLWKETLEAIENHPFKNDIIVTGKVSFLVLATLYASAKMFIFPSLYEGFGIPVLEAMAAGVPVVCSNNSSLPEVGGDAVLYFESSDAIALANHIESLWRDDALCQTMIAKGFENIKKFSWDKCAKETLEYILK
jgi:glycosyltransferase involved in cell wall biosynthesis